MKRQSYWLNHLFNFLAVILGVYLAFFMNEKAKTKEDKKESMMLINSLIQDLSADIKTYEEYQIPVNIKHQENVDSLLNLLVENNLEGINNQLPTIFQLENYTPTTSTYTSMKASGTIRLIADLTLQKKLTDYYEGLVIENIKKGELQANFFTDELLTWLTYNADFMNMEILNKEELIVLRNKLMIYGSLINQKVENYEMTVEESGDLRMHLDSLLKVK